MTSEDDEEHLKNLKRVLGWKQKHEPDIVIDIEHPQGSNQEGDERYPERKYKPHEKLTICALCHSCFKGSCEICECIE